MDFPPVPSPRAVRALAAVRVRKGSLFTEITALDPEKRSQFGKCANRDERMALHEILDDTVELGALVAESFLTSRQSPEVLGGLWDSLSLKCNS
jgi:hypothetical protein